jgi:hypothetical protein
MSWKKLANKSLNIDSSIIFTLRESKNRNRKKKKKEEKMLVAKNKNSNSKLNSSQKQLAFLLRIVKPIQLGIWLGHYS